MAINLSRNTKVYFTTNVDSGGKVIEPATTASSATNTFQIQVLDGYSFSQATTQSTIQLSEAGDTPSRGQRAFNTALNPVDFSFSTYIRPSLGATTGPVTAAEKVLWNALLGDANLDTAGTTVTSITRLASTSPVIAATASPLATVVLTAALSKTYGGSTATVALAAGDIININGVTQTSFNQPVKINAVNSNTYTVEYAIAPAVGTTATITAAVATSGAWGKGTVATTDTGNFSYVSTMGSNKNQLLKFGLIFAVDTVLYAIDNCAMDQASVDFGLDAIAMCAWTGKGTGLRQMTATAITSAAVAPTLAPYITNKLSTMTLKSNIGGSQHTTTAAVVYNIPITGGNITIANNIAYQTPTNLAVVNAPIGYYTGQRSISGNVTAYLRTGGSGSTAADAGQLLSALLTASAATTGEGVEPKYAVRLEMGGSTAKNRVEFDMPGVVLQIPAVNIADVVATTINFNAQGFVSDVVNSQTFDVTANNELLVRYFSDTVAAT